MYINTKVYDLVLCTLSRLITVAALFRGLGVKIQILMAFCMGKLGNICALHTIKLLICGLTRDESHWTKSQSERHHNFVSESFVAIAANQRCW